MAVKLVQNINRLNTAVGVGSTSAAIPLKSGYIRVSVATTGVGAYVEIGNDPVATVNSFHVPTQGGAEIFKERIARQRISGIVTGTTTTLVFGENNGNPFASTDYVCVQGSSTPGIAATHVSILSSTDNSITLNYNTASVVGAIDLASAIVVRSVKVSALTYDTGTVSLSEVVTLTTE